MNTSKNIKFAIIFLAGALIGLIGYSRFFAVSIDEGEMESSTGGEEIATTTEMGDIVKDVTVGEIGEPNEQPILIKKESVPVQKQATLPLPDLDRIVINAHISADKKQEYTGRMKDIANAIRRGEPLFQHLLELASYRRLSEDYQGAEEIWLYMTKRYPTDRMAYENLGNLYHYYLKDYPKAEVAMKKSIEIENVYPPSYVNLVELYTLSYTEKKGLAEEVLLDGLKNTNNHIVLEVTLAQLYAEEGKTEEARIYFEKVLKFANDMKDMRLKEIADEGLAKLASTTAGI